MKNQNSLVAEMNAHVARMKIIADNSSDPLTQKLATQAGVMANQLLKQTIDILDADAKKSTQSGGKK